MKISSLLKIKKDIDTNPYSIIEKKLQSLNDSIKIIVKKDTYFYRKPYDNSLVLVEVNANNTFRLKYTFDKKINNEFYFKTNNYGFVIIKEKNIFDYDFVKHHEN